MRAIFILLLFTQSLAHAVSKSPVLLRACVNKTDSVITLSWTKISDACGSFTGLDIYGNKDGGLFYKIGTVSDINQQSFAFKVGDPNAQRSYYLSIHALCDMLDSAQSLTVAIDDQIPSSTPLDSLSYDYYTQNIIAGWKSNKTPDTDRYRLTRPNGSSDEEIAYTQDTFYTITTNPDDVFYVKLATVDSCDFHSKISTAHRVCYLSAGIDTCKREMYLNWLPYQGWASLDSQVLYINRNHGGLEKYSSFDASVKNYTFTDFVLGDTLCFFIRSYGSGGITSTSNIRCIETRAFIIPEYLYLDQVTVLNDAEISITWSSGSRLTDIGYFHVLRSDDNGAPVFLKSLNNTSGIEQTFSTTDSEVKVHEQYYGYMVESYNRCQEKVQSSLLNNSIYLSIDPGANHNPYINWDGEVEYYQLKHRAPESSTWNVYATSSTPIALSTLDSAGCFYIEAFEYENSYGKAASSVSNMECLIPELQVYVPNSVNLGSENNRFIVIGTGIDHTISSYQIFNRWGEMLVDQSTALPWYGDYLGEKVPQGIYLYVINVVGLNGELKTYTGVLRIIEGS